MGKRRERAGVTEFAVKGEKKKKKDLMRLPVDARHPEARCCGGTVRGGTPEGSAQDGAALKTATIAFPSHLVPRGGIGRPQRTSRGRDRCRPAPVRSRPSPPPLKRRRVQRPGSAVLGAGGVVRLLVSPVSLQNDRESS